MLRVKKFYQPFSIRATHRKTVGDIENKLIILVIILGFDSF